MDRQKLKVITIILVSLVLADALTLLLFSFSLLPSGERRLGPVENIHGIPYARGDTGIHIDEPLAHADGYIDQPVFGKNLVLKIEFIPTHIVTLAVGVRENSFWLSYGKNKLYSSQRITNHESRITNVTIPLTDKLQEPDQSVDLMFFAEGENPEWELVSLKTEVEPAWPTWTEFKDYARAIVYKERAL